jgi:hypothetical protein
MQKQAEFDHEQRMAREAEKVRQQQIEAKVRESDQLMNMLRQTEVQIIDICDRGQKELLDRKTNRMSGGGGGTTPTNQGSQNNTIAINKTNASIIPPSGSHNTTGIEYNNPYSAHNSMELRLPYYQQQYEKENHSLNQPQVVANMSYHNQPMKLPSHQQTLYQHTNEGNNYADESSLSEASSLSESQQRYDSMLIEKHKQVKKEYEDYK